MSSHNIVLGPLLGLEGEHNKATTYSVCFLSETDVDAATLSYRIDQQSLQSEFTLISSLNRGKFWRAEITIPLAQRDQVCHYQILIDAQPASDAQTRNALVTDWAFFCPAANQRVQLAFASCNGFSSDKLRAQHPAPIDYLWQRMQQQQVLHMAAITYKEVVDAPYAALIMGGDQIYADAIFNEKQPLYAWSLKPLKEQLSAPVSDTLRQRIDHFYLDTYIRSWTKSAALRYCLASIPTIMMWDDHDIIDGWGSQPYRLETSPTYQAMFDSAKKYFTLFQVRGNNRALQQNNAASAHFGMTLRFRDYGLLVMDNRSQRTLHNIMGSGKQDFIQGLADLQAGWQAGQKLLVLSGVPFLYRHFSESDRNIRLSIQFDAYDDMADHWRFSTHYDEMCSILQRLLQFQAALQAQTPSKVFIISGDVHVAASGAYREQSGTGNIVQLISSGIVHPPPLSIEQSVIRLASSIEQPDIDLGGGCILSAKIRKDAAGNRFLFHRNYACMHEGGDHKVWVNWHYETIDFPNTNDLAAGAQKLVSPTLGYQVLGLPY
ncbi:alkaline phosphatase D family protein [Methylophilus sp. 5]|uniref:alkaline phosphatase D family protein n=1 Tax=Methylophilus sp. 5 TaxID=1112274 RepID=UPI00048CA054|nr:alkaline phosphatase D family protein [Methylophilus sp. 5]